MDGSLGVCVHAGSDDAMNSTAAADALAAVLSSSLSSATHAKRLQVFEQWHARKRAERDAKRAADAEDRKKKVRRGDIEGRCTGRCSR